MSTAITFRLPLALFTAVVLACGSVSLVFAEETSASANADASIKVNAGGILKKIKDEKKNIIQNIKGEREVLHIKAGEIRSDINDTRKAFNVGVRASSTVLRADFKTQMKTASSSEERKNVVGVMRDTLKDFRAGVKDRRADMRKGFEEKRAELKAERERIAKEHMRLITARFNATIEFYRDIMTRIDARIAKLQSQGADVTAALSASAAAKVAIDAAATASANVDAKITAALATSTPRGQLTEIRSATHAAEQALKSAHRAIQATVKALKTTQASITVHASTTVQN